MGLLTRDRIWKRLAQTHSSLPRFNVFSFALLFLLLAACGGTNAPANPAPSENLLQQFDDAWATFDRNYSYFDYKRVDWPALKQKYRPSAAQATTEDQLVGVVRQMLSELKDQHVKLKDPAGVVSLTWDPQYFVNWDKALMQQYLRGAGWVQGGTNWGYANFGGVPYFVIGSWVADEVSVSGLDAALENFRNAPAIIIDVRMNQGGNDDLAYQFAQRFADQTRVTGYYRFREGPNHSDFGPLLSRSLSPRGSWQFHRPVYLLIGRRCLSSNESFITAMSELPNVVLVGDTTGGGSGNPATFQLGGGWSYTVSRWIAYTASMRVIEGNGLEPDVRIPMTAADIQSGRDPVLEYAITNAGGSLPQ